MKSSTVNSSSTAIRPQYRTEAVSAASAGETASAYLTRVLDIADDATRESLIDDAYERLIASKSADRPFWYATFKALIDGRSEAEKDRRHAEFMVRNER